MCSGYKSMRCVICRDFLSECYIFGSDVNHELCLISLICPMGLFWRVGIKAKSSVGNSFTCLVLKY